MTTCLHLYYALLVCFPTPSSFFLEEGSIKQWYKSNPLYTALTLAAAITFNDDNYFETYILCF